VAARDFAQIGCCDAKTGAPRKLFFDPQVRQETASTHHRRRHRRGARVRANDGALRNAQLFSSIFSQAHPRAECARDRRRLHRARNGGGFVALAAGRPGHIRVSKVLTVEKTVIRFRPADGSCGSK